jgi:4-amino-4-deoxy-L-arabinose transferase-like glycosyltransferase
MAAAGRAPGQWGTVVCGLSEAESVAARRPHRVSFLVGLLLLAAAALAVRLVYILVIARAPVGVGGDAGFYHSAANLIAHGHFLYRGIFGHAYVTQEHPPLFPVVLSVSSLFGGDSLLAHRIVGCALGSLAVVLIAMLGERAGGRSAGYLAGALAAVYPPLVTADGLVMSEPLFVVLTAAALLAALHAQKAGRIRDAALLGALIGLATLTRGEGILLLPLLAWPAAWLGTRAGRARRIAASTAAALILLGPWVVRNAVVFGHPSLAADANTLIAGANCRDTYYGHDVGWWSLDCMVRSRTRSQVLHGDASTAKAFSYAGAHLVRLPLIAAVRVLRSFDLFQPLRQGNREPRRRWVDVVGLVFYYPLLVLAAFGLRVVRLPRWTLLAPVGMVVIVSALGWGIGRFRVAADVSLLVLAACTLARGPRRQPARTVA